MTLLKLPVLSMFMHLVSFLWWYHPEVQLCTQKEPWPSLRDLTPSHLCLWNFKLDSINKVEPCPWKVLIISLQSTMFTGHQQPHSFTTCIIQIAGFSRPQLHGGAQLQPRETNQGNADALPTSVRNVIFGSLIQNILRSWKHVPFQTFLTAESLGHVSVIFILQRYGSSC